MPVFNGEQYIERALDSVLDQTYRDLEVVVSDNASSDETEQIVREYARRDCRVFYQRNDRNLGAAANYNLVFQRSRGEFFKWAAHDDYLAPTFLAEAVAVLDREPRVTVCLCDFEFIDEFDRTKRVAKGPTIRGDLASERIRKLVDLQVASPDVYWSVFGLVRSASLRRTDLIGPYVASDQTLLFHLMLLGELVSVPETLWFRREHEGESMVRHRTAYERARWFDTEVRRPDRLMPNWRLLAEHLELLRAETLRPGDITRCSAQVMRRFSHKWRAMGSELTADRLASE